MTIVSIINTFIVALSEASVLALVTFGIILIFRTSFTTNFAQGMIASASAYISTILYLDIFSKHISSSFLVTLLSFLAAITTGFILGFLIDAFLVRKAKFSTPLTKQIITMGVVVMLTGLLPLISKSITSDTPRSAGFFPVTPKQIQAFGGIININMNRVFAIVVSLIVIIVLFLMLKKTRWGLAVRSTAANEKTASMMGVNTKFITAMSWGLAGAVAALAAMLLNTMVSPVMMVTYQVAAFLALILGGAGTFIGPVISAYIIIILRTIINMVTASISIPVYGSTSFESLSVYYEVLMYVVVLFIILIKPAGLFGKRIAKKV